MTVTWNGALYCGPEPDNSRYYSAPMGSTPAGDFAIVIVTQLQNLYLGGDPTASVSLSPGISLGQNFAAGNAGTGGNDSYLAVVPRNAGGASKGHLKARLASGAVNMLATGTTLEGSTVFRNGDTVVIVLQSDAGTMQLKTCLAGSTTVTTEASGARNTNFTTASLGTWNFGNSSFGGYLQGAFLAAQALTDADIVNLAAGVDPETIIASGNRLLLWQFNSTAASIPAVWGATPLTRTGTWTKQTVAAPPIPNAAARIAVTNEPVPYGAVAVNDDGTAPTWTITGTYTGFTPSSFQARVEDQFGGNVVGWTDMGAFTASGGTWSGTVAVPVGGLYRLHVRDKTSTSTIWRGGNPWSCCPVQASVGQSPMVYLETVYTGIGAATLVPGNCYFVLSGYSQVFKASSNNIGPGLIASLNAYSAASGGVPLVAALTAVGGTSSTQWAGRDALVWPQFLAALDYLRAGRVLLSWLNGAADSTTPPATIKANHTTILANLDADLATARGIGYRYRLLPHNRDTQNSSNDRSVRVAQYEWAAAHPSAGTKVLIGPWWPDMQTNTEVLGTAQAGTTNTITLAATEPTTGLTAGMAVSITGGTGAGQSATVSSYSATTKVLTISGTWTTVPDATSTYRIVGASPHPNVAAVLAYGPRLGQDSAYWFGYSRISGQGPTPLAATYPASGAGSDGTVLTVTFAHRHGGALRTPRGGTGATSVAGFQVSEDDFATTKTLTSVVISGAKTVRITLATPPTSKTSLKVRYGAPDPVPAASFDTVGAGLADLLYDDTRVTPTGGLPAYMTLSGDLPVTEATASTPPAGAPRTIKSLVLVNGVGLRKITAA